jgi:hypothetical protein
MIHDLLQRGQCSHFLCSPLFQIQLICGNVAAPEPKGILDRVNGWAGGGSSPACHVGRRGPRVNGWAGGGSRPACHVGRQGPRVSGWAGGGSRPACHVGRQGPRVSGWAGRGSRPACHVGKQGPRVESLEGLFAGRPVYSTKSAYVAMANYNQKVNWVFTYGASSGYISFQMFKDEGTLFVDECHSTSDGPLVYTYIHLQRKCSKSTVVTCMKRMGELHGMIMSTIFGYDAIGSNENIGEGVHLTEHIAFRMVYEHMKSNNAAFKSCTDGVSGVTRGLLMQLDGFAKIKEVLSIRNKRLLPFLENIENELKQAKKTVEQETSRADYLATERAILLMHIEHFKKQNLELHHKNIDLEVKLIVDASKRERDEMIKAALGNINRPLV